MVYRFSLIKFCLLRKVLSVIVLIRSYVCILQELRLTKVVPGLRFGQGDVVFHDFIMVLFWSGQKVLTVFSFFNLNF